MEKTLLTFLNLPILDAKNGEPTDAVYVDEAGNIGIGTTELDYRLHVDGTAYATGAAGALSDHRYKKNIEDLKIEDLKVVKKLNPVTFQWKEPKDK